MSLVPRCSICDSAIDAYGRDSTTCPNGCDIDKEKNMVGIINLQTQSEYVRACDAAYKGAARASMAVLIVPAAVADDLGANGLQLVANRAGRNVITERESRYHSDKLFRPQAETGS